MHKSKRLYVPGLAALLVVGARAQEAQIEGRQIRAGASEVSVWSELGSSLPHMLGLQLPGLLIGGIGLWLALRWRRAYPRVSLWACIGFGCLLVNAVSFIAVQSWVQVAVAQGGGVESFQALGMWNLITYPLNLIGPAALAVAIFVERPGLQRQRREQ